MAARSGRCRLTIARELPTLPGWKLPAAGALVAGIAIGSRLIPPADWSGLILSGALAAGSCLLLGYRLVAARRIRRLHHEFLHRVEQEVAAAEQSLPTGSLPGRFRPDPGEMCLWAGKVKWFEPDRPGHHPSRPRFGRSIPIGPGIHYRIEAIAPSILPGESLALADLGDLCLTDRRVVFAGRTRQTTLAYSEIAGVRVFPGGLNLERGRAPTPTLLIERGAERAAALIAHRLRESPSAVG